MSKKQTAGGNGSTYTTECYLREVKMQIESPRSIEIVCDPGEGWQVERDSKKYIILEKETSRDSDQEKPVKGNPAKCKWNAVVLEELTCEVDSSCDGCLLKQLVQVKLDKARIRLTLLEKNKEDNKCKNKNIEYKVKAITLI